MDRCRSFLAAEIMDQFEEQVGASGLLLAGFAGVVAVLLATAPPTAEQLASSDPLVQLAASLLDCGVFRSLRWLRLRSGGMFVRRIELR